MSAPRQNNSEQSTVQSTVSRRDFLVAAAVAPLALTFAQRPPQPVPRYGIAWTSIPVRMRQAAQRDPNRKPAVPAEEFIKHCHSFGATGCQMGFDQLVSQDAAYLKTIRALLDEKQMFLELGVSSRTLENADALARVATAAHQLGVERLRIACLSGRRYEDFSELKKWQDFANHWKQTLRQVEPLFKQHKLRAGIENHKDWLADEQVEILKSISSPYLGACVDFGNNLSLLEDSLEVARKLAPYVITTHLKDMAVRPYEDGFELSEVAVGEGITPLKEIIAVLRRVRRDVPLVLEMITRDPLKVPYKTDKYWATFGGRDTARIEKFERGVLSRASSKPLPRVTGLTPEQAQASEDENIRRSTEYTRKHLSS
jgi:3-oxoisoapionate decarboxylase